MLLEVDSERTAAPDLAIRRKRLRFYRRLGEKLGWGRPLVPKQ